MSNIVIIARAADDPRLTDFEARLLTKILTGGDVTAQPQAVAAATRRLQATGYLPGGISDHGLAPIEAHPLQRGLVARMARYHGAFCRYCASLADSVDHVVPRARGGVHSWLNVVPCCRSCNTRKRDRAVESFLRSRSDLLQGLFGQMVWAAYEQGEIDEAEYSSLQAIADAAERFPMPTEYWLTHALVMARGLQ